MTLLDALAVVGGKGYCLIMEPRIGKVVNGAIVLEDGDDLEEGAAVTVWVGESDRPVRATPEELELIAQGRAAVARGEVLDARNFLAELPREG